MSAEGYKKTYVTVNVDVDEEGNIRPRFIRLKNGCIFGIDRLKYKCRAASTRVDGGGIRYTVEISGRSTFLFNEGGRWFVEERCMYDNLGMGAGS